MGNLGKGRATPTQAWNYLCSKAEVENKMLLLFDATATE